MKKLLTTLSILLISLVFIVPIQASAATSAGVKPGSFFYFFDTAFENIGLFFTLNPEKKAQKALEHADERLAEAEESAVENNPKAVEKAMTGYKEEISFATEKSKGLKDEKRADELLNIVSENTAKHQEILEGVLEKVPEKAKQAILNAIEVSKKGQEEAVRQIAELRGEVERLRQGIAELKAKGEERERKIEGLGEQKTESVVVQPKTVVPQTQTTPTPKTGTTQSQTAPKTEAQNSAPATSKAEENFSDVAVKLYSDQIDMHQFEITAISEYKNASKDIKQIWSDRLLQTQIYLNTYPNDARLKENARIYNLLVELSDAKIADLNEKEGRVNAAKDWILANRIKFYQNKLVSRSNMQGIFEEIDILIKARESFKNDLTQSFQEYKDVNRKAAVSIDAVNNVEVAKRQQDIEDTTRLMAETDRLLLQSQALLQQHQNTVNAYKTTYCTATNLGLGQTSIVCQ